MFKNLIKKKKEKLDDIERPWKKLYGNVPDTLTYFDGSIYEMVYNNHKNYSSFTALEYFKTTITYKALMTEIDFCASALIRYGIKENDIVTICCANTPEAIIAFYAVNKIGAIANMVHPLSSENEIKTIINESKTNFLFINDIIFDKIKTMEKEINIVKTVIIPISNSMDFVTKTLYSLITKSKVKVADLNDDYILWNNFKDVKITDTFIKRKSEDDAVILYSGGTTGKSKGVVLSNLAFNSMAKQAISFLDSLKAGTSILSYLPIFHGFGLSICINLPLTIGMKCILLPKIDAPKVNHIIKTKKPNFMPVVPSLLNVMLKDKKVSKKAFKSIITVVSGGDFLSIDLKTRSEEFLADHGCNAPILIGYGLTECTAAAVVTIPGPYKSGCVGIPLSDNLVKIVKANTHIRADVNEMGEICITGPTLMSRYLNNEEETFKTLRVHEDGRLWLHTGDLGSMDKDGQVYFSTRLKRMIISNGINIYPSELENIFTKHTYIESAVVIGVEDKIKVQSVKAMIVLKDEIKLSEKVKSDIKEYASKNISKFALPSSYEFIKELPKTKMGKIDYRKLQGKDSE